MHRFPNELELVERDGTRFADCLGRRYAISVVRMRIDLSGSS